MSAILRWGVNGQAEAAGPGEQVSDETSPARTGSPGACAPIGRNRHHVHLSIGEETARRVGGRDDGEVDARLVHPPVQVLGRGGFLWAGALLTEGTEIPLGSLVLGVPAKVVRQDDTELGPGRTSRKAITATLDPIRSVSREPGRTPPDPLGGPSSFRIP